MPGPEITPHFLDLVYSAALASFHRKKALRAFLRRCGISENFLSSWHSDERKRDFLDRLFERLDGNAKTPALLTSMARYLAEQTTFPDLDGWEDSQDKISKAQDACRSLRAYLEDADARKQQEEERIQSRRRYEEAREKVARSQQSLQKLTNRLNDLTTRMGTQKAGYDFQDWFFDLLDFAEIQNRRPYVTGGRQIDGSLTHDGTTYIIELKFTTTQSSSTDIDSLKAKVSSKADNTMGIFISMSGYASVAISEASGPKTTLLLLDHTHVFAVLTGVSNMHSVIDRVRRHAAQTGDAHLPIDKFSQ